MAAVKSDDPAAEIERITLIDRRIEYRRNRGACRTDDRTKPIARCAIDDDMQGISPSMREPDVYILGVPISEGTVNALTETFPERIWRALAQAGRWPIRAPETSNLLPEACSCDPEHRTHHSTASPVLRRRNAPSPRQRSGIR